MDTAFHPFIVDRGTFRVALCLTELGESAWEVLQLSQTLGFNRPEFVIHNAQSWAILLNQKHDFNTPSETVLATWDDRLQQLWQAADGHLSINTNFQDCLQPGLTQTSEVLSEHQV
jgi:hypothetical protein